MANKYSSNFAIPGSTNAMQVLWKLTRVMKAAGWNTVSHSDGTTKTAAGTNGNDSWGTNADPLVDTYPTFDAAAPWIVLEGPSTLKIPLASNVSGTPLRGEKVTQTATSFEGEYLGHIWDGYNSTGYMVVLPRVNTPTNATNIVGSTSAATFTPVGTIVTYKRQVMLSKTAAGTNVSGVIYYVCADASGESASLFSALATSAGATATVPPGCGGTGNSLPTIAIVVRGTASSTTGAAWFGNTTSGFGTSAQIACANAVAAANTSADGSFWCALSTTSLNTMTGLMFTRVDDQEPGDVDPYVFINETGASFTTWVRTTATGTNSATNLWTNGNLSSSSASGPTCLGYHARGIGNTTKDVVAPFYLSSLSSAGVAGVFFQTISTVGTARILNSPATTPPLIRETVFAVCPAITTGSFRHIKGRCRWLAYMSIGTSLDTYDTKSWFCTTTVTTSSPAIALGPYDGTTTPVP